MAYIGIISGLHWVYIGFPEVGGVAILGVIWVYIGLRP